MPDYNTPPAWGKFILNLAFVVTLGLGAGCQNSNLWPPFGTQPLLKIGLVAPFEGIYRADGYQRLYGTKLALQEVNAAGGLAGHKIALIALNDHDNERETVLQAQELVLDSDVYLVIGPWDANLRRAAAPIYAEANLLSLDPNDYTNFHDLPETFDQQFREMAGTPPSDQARQAYLATRSAMNLLSHSLQGTAPDRTRLWERYFQSSLDDPFQHLTGQQHSKFIAPG